MTVITKDNVNAATPWEPTAASTQATLDLDLSTLKHDLPRRRVLIRSLKMSGESGRHAAAPETARTSDVVPSAWS